MRAEFMEVRLGYRLCAGRGGDDGSYRELDIFPKAGSGETVAGEDKKTDTYAVALPKAFGGEGMSGS